MFNTIDIDRNNLTIMGVNHLKGNNAFQGIKSNCNRISTE
jgi:hypothetical protein